MQACISTLAIVVVEGVRDEGSKSLVPWMLKGQRRNIKRQAATVVVIVVVPQC